MSSRFWVGVVSGLPEEYIQQSRPGIPLTVSIGVLLAAAAYYFSPGRIRGGLLLTMLVGGLAALCATWLGWQVRQAAWREAFVQAETLATADFAEGVAALLEKREPRFRGA